MRPPPAPEEPWGELGRVRGGYPGGGGPGGAGGERVAPGKAWKARGALRGGGGAA